MATPTAEIIWLKNGRKIPKDNDHYQIVHKHSRRAVLSVLRIFNTMATDNGQHTCLASNPVISRKKHAYIKVSQCGMSIVVVSLYILYS